MGRRVDERRNQKKSSIEIGRAIVSYLDLEGGWMSLEKRIRDEFSHIARI